MVSTVCQRISCLGVISAARMPSDLAQSIKLAATTVFPDPVGETTIGRSPCMIEVHARSHASSRYGRSLKLTRRPPLGTSLSPPPSHETTRDVTPCKHARQRPSTRAPASASVPVSRELARRPSLAPALTWPRRCSSCQLRRWCRYAWPCASLHAPTRRRQSAAYAVCRRSSAPLCIGGQSRGPSTETTPGLSEASRQRVACPPANDCGRAFRLHRPHKGSRTAAGSHR